MRYLAKFSVICLVVSLILFISAFDANSEDSFPSDKIYNLDAFYEMLPEYTAQFKVGDRPGAYSYMMNQKRPDTYGVTDMLYLYYTLDMLDLSDRDRGSWINLIQKFQNDKTGWWEGNRTMHGREHITAYAVGALKLLGASPQYPLSFKYNYDTPEEIAKMFEETPWNIIWSGSHIASGIASALINNGDVDETWVDDYIGWLDEHADPATGYWMMRDDGTRKEKVTRDELGGAFHYYYIYTYTGRPLPHPEKIIDATISVQQENGLYHDDVPYCIDLDGVFAIIHAYRQTDGYRTEDVKVSLEKTLAAIVQRLNDREFLFKNYRDSHKLVGALVALAEIQDFMPEKLKTSKPLKCVLAESPFI